MCYLDVTATNALRWTTGQFWRLEKGRATRVTPLDEGARKWQADAGSTRLRGSSWSFTPIGRNQMQSCVPLSRLLALSLWFLVTSMLSARMHAQCATQWLPGDGLPGTNGLVNAITSWDPDGAGPLLPVLVLGGQFTTAGNALASRIALYDPVSGVWSALGTGMNDEVLALLTLPNGDLVAGGRFTTAGGVSANRIARWNGTS